MKQIAVVIFFIVLAVSLTAVAFTFNQVDNEKDRLTVDLQRRSTLLAESFRETIEPNFINNSHEYLQTVVEKFSNRERLGGMAIYDHTGLIVANSSKLPREIVEKPKIAIDAMDEDTANGGFVTVDGRENYLLAIPLHDDTSVVGSLMIVQNAEYIDTRLIEIWKNNLARLFLQIFLITVAILLTIRWLIFEPVRKMAESLRMAGNGNGDSSKLRVTSFFLKPLTKEITNIRRNLVKAKLAASEEVRQSLKKLDAPWTEERLQQFVRASLANRSIVVVSNREPYIHTKAGNTIDVYCPASGMVTAIEPMMRACGGTWIASGTGDADKLVVDKNDHVQVPPANPKYTLRRVWLTEEEEQRYYNGFSNEGLWALCHNAHTRPIFRKEDWEEYVKVNQKFAQAVLKEIKDLRKPIIFIQDFHHAILPRMIKQQRPNAVIGLFWHVPWVNPESFSICPWKKEILDGMLGADILGFHTQLHCNNFIETVGRELESLIDYEQFTITRNEHMTVVKPFPISIDFSNGHAPDPADLEEKKAGRKYLEKLGITTEYFGFGVDRLDYTKGILERLKAIEIFLEKYPVYRGRFTFLQIAAPSRSKIKRYQEFAQDVENEVERINALYAKNSWKPVVLLKKHHSHEELYRLYRLANVCLVTSLHDGMNLVAKEFIASRSDEQGVLILSQFTGASRELKDALIVNPYDGVQTAEAIYTALEMPLSEQTKRMKKLRETIRTNNVYRWSAEFLRTMVDVA